jgi:hypothetical protein
MHPTEDDAPGIYQAVAQNTAVAVAVSFIVWLVSLAHDAPEIYKSVAQKLITQQGSLLLLFHHLLFGWQEYNQHAQRVIDQTTVQKFSHSSTACSYTLLICVSLLADRILGR